MPAIEMKSSTHLGLPGHLKPLPDEGAQEPCPAVWVQVQGVRVGEVPGLGNQEPSARQRLPAHTYPEENYSLQKLSFFNLWHKAAELLNHAVLLTCSDQSDIRGLVTCFYTNQICQSRWGIQLIQTVLS